MPLAGIEPALLAELDFESSASTNSATGAIGPPIQGMREAAEYSCRGPPVNPRATIATATPQRDRRRLDSARHARYHAVHLGEASLPVEAAATSLHPRGDARPALAAASAIALIAAATLAGAWFFQLVLDIRPCPLCLEQRYAYYLAVPLALLVALVAASKHAPLWPLITGLAILIAVALCNAGLGSYHAGVEWGFWQGPTECTGPVLDLGSAGSLLDNLDKVKVVRCDEVQWRFLGLSLAGYNVLISLLMVAFGARGILRTLRRG